MFRKINFTMQQHFIGNKTPSHPLPSEHGPRDKWPELLVIGTHFQFKIINVEVSLSPRPVPGNHRRSPMTTAVLNRLVVTLTPAWLAARSSGSPATTERGPNFLLHCCMISEFCIEAHPTLNHALHCGYQTPTSTVCVDERFMNIVHNLSDGAASNQPAQA